MTTVLTVDKKELLCNMKVHVIWFMLYAVLLKVLGKSTLVKVKVNRT